MKAITKRKNLSFSIALIFIALIMTMLSLTLTTVFAHANVTTQYDQNFFSSANTYNATITEKNIPEGGGTKYDSISYNFTQKNGNIVSDDAPQVTFITHGLGGSEAHWSNDSENGDWKFGYSEGSVMELLLQKADARNREFKGA